MGDTVWGQEDEKSVQYALACRKAYVRVLLGYGYEYDDILQEMRLAALRALQRHADKGWQRSTLIDRACHYRLMHLVRYEGKRARLYK